MSLAPAIEDYVNYNKAHGFIHILIYNSEEQTESGNESGKNCVDALTLLTTLLDNSQEGSSQYSITSCDYQGTGKEEDGVKTQAILASSSVLLQFHSYPQGKYTQEKKSRHRF